MLKSSPWILLVILTALLACGSQTPAPGGAEATVPAAAGAATSAPAPEPTETPAPTESQAERPTAAPRAKPTNSPTPETTATPAPLGVLAPLHALDSGATLSELSDAELACIGENPERQTRFFGCLENETIDRIFLAGFVPGPAPLSQESSDCVRAGFAVIDPRAVMTAGIEGDPGRAMAGRMAGLFVTMACLNDEEGETAGPQVGMGPEEREGRRCLLAELGGPGQMAGAMKAAQEGDITGLALAGTECGLDMGPPPRKPPGTPPPAPTATVEAPTPVSTPVTTGATPTVMPATPTPAPHPTVAPPTQESSTTLTLTVAPIAAVIPDYDRSDWRHWIDEDGDCQDTRQEVLITESLVAVTFEADRQCRVETGQWYGAFDGHDLENTSYVDIDHMVPLRNAHLSGAWAWSPEKKEQYANNLEDDDHLIAVASRANRSKGARGPEEWMPSNQGYWCQYATDWAEIKARWELTMTEPEAWSVVEMLDTCEDPPQVEVRTTLGTNMEGIRLDPTEGTLTGEPTPDSEAPAYESCEEAAEAGEQRVQGSQGGGRGFPRAMVPSAPGTETEWFANDEISGVRA